MLHPLQKDRAACLYRVRGDGALCRGPVGQGLRARRLCEERPEGGMLDGGHGAQYAAWQCGEASAAPEGESLLRSPINLG